MSAVEQRFGPYGGRYVPETLIGALDELTAAWEEAREDPDFNARQDALRRDFIGRPTPLYLAERLSERVGSRVYLKREDLAHTGAHKINNALGQTLLAVRMGKSRIIAETGAGQHGVATATACALLGLECVVYMGTEDIRRQAPNVERMKLLGAEVAPVEAGARTLKEAVSAAIRDWVANVETTHYVIGSAVGPAPYPALVRDLQRVIGEEAREQSLAVEGALPRRVIACVGGGSNAIGIFAPFYDDAEVALVGVEAGGEGIETGRHGASLGAGQTGVLHGSLSAIVMDEDGQIQEAHSVSAGLDYPGTGPEHAYLRDTGRASYHPMNDDGALTALRELARLEGIIPALESSHAIAWLLENPLEGEGFDVLCLSGRGDKDLAEYVRRTSELIAGEKRIRAAFDAASAEGRAALMPYMMAGYPDRDAGLAVARAYVDAGADLIELGVPFSDPLADGPTVHSAGTQALANGATLRTALEACEAVSAEIPVVLMVYVNMVLAHGGAAEFAGLARAAGAAGVIVPDLPLGEAEDVRDAFAEAGLAMVPLVAPTTSAERRKAICEVARGFVYLVSTVGTTGERAEVPAALADLVAETKADAGETPVAVGFGISTGAQAAQVGEIADGVIVGSRLVRAAGEGASPAESADSVAGFLAEARVALAG